MFLYVCLFSYSFYAIYYFTRLWSKAAEKRHKNLTKRLSAALHAGWRPAQLVNGLGASGRIRLAEVDKLKPKKLKKSSKKSAKPKKAKKKKAKPKKKKAKKKALD